MQAERCREEGAGKGETTHKASWSLVKISTELQHFGLADNTVNKNGTFIKRWLHALSGASYNFLISWWILELALFFNPTK